MKLNLRTILISGVAVAVLATTQAHAQDTAASSNPDEAVATTSASGLQDIIVTANRRATNIQKTPLSITAISGEALETKGILDTAALAQVTPGLTFNQNASFAQPYIRGVGTDITTPGSESSVATYIDDVYQPFPFVGVQTLNAIERIEVLKGPQGTLYGRNATGGAINVQTRNPGREFTADADFSYGNYDAILARGYVSVPFSDSIAANLAVAVSDRGGFGTNLVDGSDYNQDKYQSIRGKIRIDISNDLELLVSGSYFHRNDDSFQAYTYINRYGSVPAGEVTIGSQDVYAPYPIQIRTNSYQGSAKLTWNTGSGQLVSITSYQDHKTFLFPDFLSNRTPIFDFSADDTGKAFAQDIYYRGETGSLSYVVGGTYTNSSARFDPLYVYLGSTLATASYQYVDTDALAGYAELTYKATDALSLTGGIRYSSEKKTQDRLDTYDGAGNLLSSAPRAHRRWNNFSYKALAQYQWDNAMLYAKFETGFKSGSVVASQPGLFVPPETIQSYEVGFKSELLDRTLRLNGAGFYYRYKNLQVQYTDINSGVALVESADSARIWGIEGQITVAPVQNFSVDLGLTYLNSKYTDFISSGVFVPNQQLFGPGTPGNTNVTADVTGNRLVRTPPITLSLGVNWTIPLANGGKFENTANLYFSDRYNFDITNRIKQPGYATLAGQIRYVFPDEHFSIAAYGRNITNSHYYSVSTPTSFGDQATVAPPRQYGITVGARF